MTASVFPTGTSIGAVVPIRCHIFGVTNVATSLQYTVALVAVAVAVPRLRMRTYT